MAPPTSVTAYSPESREFCFAIESVAAGTAGAAIIHELAEDVTIRYVRSYYQSAGFRKAAATRGKSYVTQRHVEVDIRLCYHSAGGDAFGLGIICGNSSEGAVTGAGAVKTHPFVPNAVGNRMNTVTLWMDYGDHAHVQQMTYGTLSTWSASINPDGALEVQLTFVCKWPTYTSTVTPTIYVGSTANYPVTPVLGSQGVYTFYNGAGAAYTNNVLQASLNLQRNVTTLPNAQGLDVADINAGELVFSGSVEFQYDGLGANSVHDDYMQYANLGDGSTHQHKVAFTNTDGHGFEIDFNFMRWQDPTINMNGEVVTITAPFNAENDESKLDAASPAYSAPALIKILNALPSVMTT